VLSLFIQFSSITENKAPVASGAQKPLSATSRIILNTSSKTLKAFEAMPYYKTKQEKK